MYFREPKASENAAYEYNIQPYFTFMSVIMPTFSALISFTNYRIRQKIIIRVWR